MSYAPERTSRRTPAAFPAQETKAPEPLDAYRRVEHLTRLLPFAETATLTDGDVIALLKRAIRIERARGAAGHGSYSVCRHAGLKLALVAEMRAQRQRKSART
jgi:hypothetical protein